MIESLFLVLFFGTLAIYLIYCSCFYFRFAFYKEPVYTTSFEPVSIIVAAHNELHQLKELIPHLIKQNYPQFEIIIVDDRSDDDTYVFLTEQAKAYSQLKIVRVEVTPDKISSKKYALILGIKAASYNTILLTDADCFPASSEWIQEMQKGFSSNKEIVLGYSPYVKKKGFLNLFIRYETFYTAFQYFSFALAGVPYMGVGRNLSYKKKLFLQNKGFGKHLSVIGGDDDLFINQVANRDNTNIVIHPSSYIYSFPKTTWKEWFLQKKRHLSVGKYYRWKHQFLLSLFAISGLLFQISFFVLVSISSSWEGIVGVYLARMIVLVLILNKSNKKLNEKISPFLLPLLDVLHTFYCVGMGIVAVFSKKVRWK